MYSLTIFSSVVLLYHPTTGKINWFFPFVGDNIDDMKKLYENLLSDFVENLNELMIDNDLSVKTFCEKLNIGKSELYRCLKKENLIAFASIIKIADYFCCSIDYLLGLAPYLSDDKLNYTPPFNIAFAQILEEHGITRYQLNKYSKISSSSIDNWYNGVHSPSLDNVIRLTKYFNCTIDKLLGRDYQ